MGTHAWDMLYTNLLKFIGLFIVNFRYYGEIVEGRPWTRPIRNSPAERGRCLAGRPSRTADPAVLAVAVDVGDGRCRSAVPLGSAGVRETPRLSARNAAPAPRRRRRHAPATPGWGPHERLITARVYLEREGVLFGAWKNTGRSP